MKNIKFSVMVYRFYGIYRKRIMSKGRVKGWGLCIVL